MRFILMLEITEKHFLHSFIQQRSLASFGVILSQFSFLGTQTTHRGFQEDEFSFSTLFHAPPMG